MRIKESDWKVFRELKKVALDRFCEQILKEIADQSADQSISFHERYLEIFKILSDRDSQLAKAFDAPGRSNALYKLQDIYFLGLLSAEEMQRFSEETRRWVSIDLVECKIEKFPQR